MAPREDASCTADRNRGAPLGPRGRDGGARMPRPAGRALRGGARTAGGRAPGRRGRPGVVPRLPALERGGAARGVDGRRHHPPHGTPAPERSGPRRGGAGRLPRRRVRARRNPARETCARRAKGRPPVRRACLGGPRQLRSRGAARRARRMGAGLDGSDRRARSASSGRPGASRWLRSSMRPTRERRWFATSASKSGPKSPRSPNGSRPRRSAARRSTGTGSSC